MEEIRAQRMSEPRDSRQNVSERDITGFVMDSTRERYQRLSWQGGFAEYLKLVAADPYRHTRTAYQLVRDMLLSFGVEEYEDNGETVKHFKLFDDPFNDGKNRIFGIERTVQKLVQVIEAGAKEEGKERIIVLHGPVGTAKTSIVDLISRGLEAYTSTPAGEVYTFAWRFGKDFGSEGVGGLGFGARTSGDYAGINNPVAVLPSQMHEHPLLLIPREERRELLTRLFDAAGISDTHIIPHKLLESELEFNSKQIYNYLIRKYEGNWLKVMDHVLVQRVQFSEGAGIGVAKVPPEGNAETASQPVSIDENFRFIANLINNISLVRYYGKYVHANRGVIQYSDIFKKPANYLQHLLGAVEEHRMDFGETGCDIDCVIAGTTNIHEYIAMRQDPVSRALRSRMRKIDVPYLRNFREEEKIYRRGLRQFKRKLKIAPHTTEMAARWAVMTRLEPTELHKDETLDEDTRKILGKVTPALKALIYAGQFPPEFTAQERQKLSPRVRRMLFNENKYEGMAGASTRTLQDLFADLCEDETVDCITPFRVFDLLEALITQGAETLDFLAREPDGEWFDFKGFISQLRHIYDGVLGEEIENSIVDVDATEMDVRVRNYLRHVSAFNKRERVRNTLTGKDEAPDENLMKQVEGAMGVKDADREQFRFKMLSRASSAAAEGKKVDIAELYQDLYTALHRALFYEKRDAIKWPDVENVLEKCRTKEQLDAMLESGAGSGAHEAYRDVKTLVRNMMSSYGYPYECVRVCVLYFIRSLLVGKTTAKR